MFGQARVKLVDPDLGFPTNDAAAEEPLCTVLTLQLHLRAAQLRTLCEVFQTSHSRPTHAGLASGVRAAVNQSLIG